MSRNPICKCCGGNGYKGSDCESLRKTIDALRAELKEARAVIRNTAETVQAFREEADKAKTEAEKARMDWHAAENELWLGELREQIEKLREQRDRALKIAEDLSATGSPGGWSYRWDSAVVELNDLLGEINKEKNAS